MVAWDRFRGPEHLTGLVSCMETYKLSLVLDRMIKDHRTYRSGLPDLTLWNPETREMKFVEVKGPGDKLSYKQILWIRFFNEIGITAEVCHVDPTGSVGGCKDARQYQPQPAAKGSPIKSPVKKRRTVQKKKVA